MFWPHSGHRELSSGSLIPVKSYPHEKQVGFVVEDMSNSRVEDRSEVESIDHQRKE